MPIEPGSFCFLSSGRIVANSEVGTWTSSLWAVSEVPTWHTDGAGMMGGGHFRYSDLKEAGAAADAYVI